jgi:hypothetical protein
MPDVTCVQLLTVQEDACLENCTVRRLVDRACTLACLEEINLVELELCETGSVAVPECFEECVELPAVCAEYCCFAPCNFTTVYTPYLPSTLTGTDLYLIGLATAVVAVGLFIGCIALLGRRRRNRRRVDDE